MDWLREERKMKKLSLRPDPRMAWIYDSRDPRYNDPQTKDLRKRREHAFSLCAEADIREAELNDNMTPPNTG